MGKTIFIPEDKISLLKEYFTRGEIGNSGENFFVFFRDKLFIFNPTIDLEEFSQTLRDGGYDKWADYYLGVDGKDADYVGRMAFIYLKDIPRLLCGYITNNELHLANNMYYDVLNSPEFKKLTSSNNFSKVYIESESGSREKLVYSNDEGEKTLADRYLPDSLYHGTTLANAISIVTKGLRPSPEKSNFSGILHGDTVFMSKDVTTACAYSAMLSHSFLVNYDKLPVVIEYDVNKMDGGRFVLDYDVYTSYGVGQDDSYEKVIDKIEPRRRQRVRGHHDGDTVDVTKDNPLKFNRVGYRGVVMPSAIKNIYVFYGRDNANMFNPQWTFKDANSFIQSLDKIREFTENADDEFNEEKKVLPPYEKDEFEIGSEGGNNDYFHINESIDASEIGEVAYSWDYDSDEYKEWLEENEITNCDHILLDYIKDYVSFDLEYFDNETRHHCGYDSVDYDGLVDLFGQKKASEIVNDCINNGEGRFETCELFDDDEFDINNPDELDNAVMRQMPHGEYYKDARGFILSNGVFVYTDAEHNAITSIKGINDKFQFIKLGNIRVLPQSIDIGKQPTYEQRLVLRQIISCYPDGKFYLDIFDDRMGEIGAEYINPDWRRVMGEIDRYYSEGIKPMGGSMYESATLKEGNTFEAWFGNSVVVDKEGKPLKMYHGSGSEFEEFKKEFIGKNGAHEGYGFNFTPYQTRAASYNNGNVLEVYLRAEHPMTTKSNNITPQLLAKIIAEIDKGTPVTDTIVAAYESPKYGEKWDENYYRRALRVAAKVIYDYNVEGEYGDAGIYADICLCGNGDVNKVIEVFESLGYDSAIFYDMDDKMNTVVVFEPNQIKKINNQSYNNDSNLMSENIETELDADEVNLTSFKPNDSLADKLWDGFELNPKARLRLLDIADDFWESTDVTWTKPVGIVLTGSICNFNWSKFSDIDLHLVVDFREVDERDDFVQEYFDGKKNAWNEAHKDLKIYGYPVEVYVENIDAETESGGIYDLEQNKWIKKPTKGEIKAIGLNKYDIKNLVAKYCTKIDNLCDAAEATDDKHVLSEIGERANKLLNRIKKMRKFGLERGGEGDPFNIAYKCYRRMGYLDKLFDIKSKLYDRIKSIGLNESTYLASSFNPLLKYFGTTSSIMRAGFVLPNGALLDLSGGDPSNNRRNISHRDVSKVGMGMPDVIKMGAIRIDAATGYITMMTKPTPEQVCVIREIVRRNGGSVQIEIGDGDNSLSYVEYEDAKPSKVVADIMRYFDEGIKLEAGVNEGEGKTKPMLTESQESKSISAAKKLVMQKLNYNEQEADEFVRVKLRNDIPVLRTLQGGKFILGATRMFCDGELRTANDIGNLNSTLKLVASDAHINEYDRNLNGLSYQDLIQRFSKAMSDNLDAERAEVNSMVFGTPSDYEIVRIDSFEQAKKYGRYVSWCVTHDKKMFNSYTSDGINQFYFCLKNGFEAIKAQASDGCPLDEYGLSMIAVSVNENGMLNTCTCRWNHDNGGDDSIMTSKEVSQVIGMNFFEVFKPNNKWKELLSNATQRLANGENPENVFDFCSEFNDGFALVYLNGKNNFINKNGKFLSNQWFDDCGSFRNGFAKVELNGKWNYINQEGQFLRDQWFDECYNFHEGFAIVALNGIYNHINQEGKFLSNQWFDWCDNFHEGFARVRLNDKWNYINQEIQFLSGQWFDWCDNFHEGFARVRLNGKYNHINQEGQFLSNQWFDMCGDFKNGLATVKLNYKWYKIDTNGKLLDINESASKKKTIIINEKQLKLINEYLDNDYNLGVYKYFKWADSASDEEKAKELAWRESYYLLDYLIELVNHGKIDDPGDRRDVERLIDLEENNDEYYQDEGFIELAIGLIEKYNVSSHFVSWCYDKINCYLLPSWMFMSYIRPVKNEWCIHFGADSDNIAREGFTGGTYELDDLAYTNAGQEKSYEGYDFAFVIDDKSVDFNNYGKEAVIFRTSGVMCYHHGDQQRQVIFWGPYAKDFIPIKYDESEGDWVVTGKNGQILKMGYPSEIAAWATENLPQYRKQIMAGKNGYIPKYYDYKLNKTVPYKLYRNESVVSYLKVLKEEVNARGNASHDVYRKRWKQERETLKRFLANNGTIMTSKENGKTYYVYYDATLSNLIGNNYCICVQYDMLTGEMGHQVYIRALDKFSQRMFRPKFDSRGNDNKSTLDDNSSIISPEMA